MYHYCICVHIPVRNSLETRRLTSSYDPPASPPSAPPSPSCPTALELLRVLAKWADLGRTRSCLLSLCVEKIHLSGDGRFYAALAVCAEWQSDVSVPISQWALGLNVQDRRFGLGIVQGVPLECVDDL